MKQKINTFITDFVDQEKLSYIKETIIDDSFGENSKKYLTDNLFEVFRCSNNVLEMILRYDEYEDIKEQFIYDIRIMMDDYVHHCAICSIYLLAIVSYEEAGGTVSNIETVSCMDDDSYTFSEYGEKLGGFIDYMKQQQVELKEEVVHKVIFHSKYISDSIKNLVDTNGIWEQVSIVKDIVGSMGLIQYLNVEMFKFRGLENDVTP